MHFLDVMQISLESLLTSKFRNLLALFGILVGVASVMLMISLGSGARSMLLDEFSSTSMNTLIIEADITNKNRVPRWFSQSDLMLIEKGSQDIREIVPINWWQTLVKYRTESVYTYVLGTTYNFTKVVHLKFESGRFFTSLEESSQIPVCVIGQKVKEDILQTEEDVVGREVQLGEVKFKIIGVLAKQNDLNMGFTGDQKIYIPDTIYRVQTGNYENEMVLLQHNPQIKTVQVQNQLKKLFNLKYNYIPFLVTPITELQDNIKMLTTVLTALLGAIGSISLVVGGIGIMNIMLVTVTERTREIGIRKALGAKKNYILAQFIIEAIVLCLTGGCLGIGLGYLGSTIVNQLSPIQSKITWETIAISLGFAVGIGVISGLYPAWKAQQLDPIESLNYE